MEAWRAKEVVPNGVEACSPRHASNGGAGGWRGARGPRWALLRRVHRRSFRSWQWAAPGGGVGRNLYGGDRFAVVVSPGQRVKVVKPDG